MSPIADYSALEILRDGRSVEIRAQRASDLELWRTAFKRVSAQTLFRRFFAVTHEPTEQQTNYFFNIDFETHVALLAVAHEDGAPRMVGICRYVVIRPGQAEVAFTVADDYQGNGLGSAMMRHLTKIARSAGLQEFIADVLAENVSMIRVFTRSGLEMTTTTEDAVVSVVLQLSQQELAEDPAPVVAPPSPS